MGFGVRVYGSVFGVGISGFGDEDFEFRVWG